MTLQLQAQDFCRAVSSGDVANVVDTLRIHERYGDVSALIRALVVLVEATDIADRYPWDANAREAAYRGATDNVREALDRQVIAADQRDPRR